VRKEICIDNGGTLTDICVFEGPNIWTTKTLTTPFDLSQCFFDGLRKVSREIYGDEDVERLLTETSAIKYSTTQGTNALVERKGPRLGLVVSKGFDPASLEKDANHRELIASLVGERVVTMDLSAPGIDLADEVIRAANALAEQGTSRIVVCFTGKDYVQQEKAFVTQYENSFPPHHLGTVPVAVSHETTGDTDDVRRIWSAVLNAFLHPPMENFLFSAQKRLRNYRGGSTLRIFRNDGGSAKVSKTSAIKTYSSGPRGGMEAVRASAIQRRFDHVVSVDVGGTTSDLGSVDKSQVRSNLRGQVEGVESSFELCDIVSIGIGGGSIIRAENGAIKVGPQSVGAAPGPACFGLGGTSATITDAALVLGILDPGSFFGGAMTLDIERARSAIETSVAKPLGLDVKKAAHAMQTQWVKNLAAGIQKHTPVRPETVLMAFGGAGPMSICDVADELGVKRVMIPKLAALFSAFGVSFSEVAQDYEVAVKHSTPEQLQAAVKSLLTRAKRDMEAEGVDFADCTLRGRVVAGGKTTDIDIHSSAKWPSSIDSLQLRVSALRARDESAPAAPASAKGKAKSAGERSIVDVKGATVSVPVYRLPDCAEDTGAPGPAILEGSFFTGYLKAGWHFSLIDGGDVLLERKS
jgi:N-methylhydantoinase A